MSYSYVSYISSNTDIWCSYRDILSPWKILQYIDIPVISHTPTTNMTFRLMQGLQLWWLSKCIWWEWGIKQQTQWERKGHGKCNLNTVSAMLFYFGECAHAAAHVNNAIVSFFFILWCQQQSFVPMFRIVWRRDCATYSFFQSPHLDGQNGPFQSSNEHLQHVSAS